MGLPAPAGGVVAQQHDPIMPGERRSDAWGWLHVPKNIEVYGSVLSHGYHNGWMV